nr:DNA-directed RNA polymerase, subunit E'' [Candidatus Bathyarchaeota archaeon]
MRERACRTCKLLVRGQMCPECKSYSLSDDYGGLLIVFDPEGSQIARRLDIKKKGKYALKVR